MTAFPYQYRQLDHRRGHINSRLNIRWWAWQWNTTKEINKHAIQVHYWRERIVTFNNEGSNYDQKHHARISMNDKHEQGKGIEIVRTKVSVTWTKSVQHRGVICQNHPVPESDVLPFLTPMEATLNIQEIDPLVPLAPGFHYILNINCNIWLVDKDMLKCIKSSSSIIVICIMIT